MQNREEFSKTIDKLLGKSNDRVFSTLVPRFV